MSNSGILFIVATPIGNLKDISFRALEVLKAVDYILCEDTRITGKLLSYFEIKKKMISFNEYSEISRISSVVGDLESGKKIALVSDAGTPLISDPGYKLVREATNQGIAIESIPGPSSIITALTVSGLPPDKFTFLGYLPKSEVKKGKVFEAIKDNQKKIKSTTIIFESPYRLLKSLESIKKVFGDIDMVVCRELTKLHEEVKQEKVSKLIEYYSKNKPKGECVILY